MLGVFVFSVSVVKKLCLPLCLENLNVDKSVGRDEVHLQVLRELLDEVHRITESLRLEKISKIIWSNHHSTTNVTH